jgi:serine/threonine protein kinase
LIETTPIEGVEYLAYCKDNHNRSAMDNATSKIRAALEEKILFLGRFEIVKGPPIHLSDTSVVLQAIDRQAVNEYDEQFDEVLKEQCHATSIDKDGLREGLSRLGFETGDERFDSYFEQSDANHDGRISRDEFVGICKTVVSNDHQGRVALKFMKNKEHFQREVDSRGNHTLGHNYIVHITGSYSSEDLQSDFAEALEVTRHAHVEDLREYKYAIVMPCADRNLDTIFRSERPSEVKIRDIAKDIADALAHLHKNGMIHGDVKLLNAVRVGTRLQLIDLDASAKIGEGSFAGAKFSSGVLPPEMIAELTIKEYHKYVAYFKTNVSAASQEKVQPKGVGGDTIFAVKTFLTKQSTQTQFGKDNKPKSIICQEPVEGLPYSLIEATAAIDIWSFGAVLYELHTGAPLFAVDRDNDLKDGASMKELYEWNDEKKMKKLWKVNDPSAYRLLKKVLSAEPSKRYKTMEELLRDRYFTSLDPTEEVELLAQIVTEKVIQGVTIVIEIKTQKVRELIESSTSVMCNAIFEATDVDTPACFIILPEKIVVDSESGDDGHWGERFEYVQEVLDKASSSITAPLDFALDYIKGKFIKKTMFLYLVDELTHEPVVTKVGVYPIQIDVGKEEAKKFLAVMAVGMKAVAVGNTVVGLIAMFYPGLIQKLIPTALTEKAEKFINCSNPEVIKQAPDETMTTVRGIALREFSAFLKEKDVKLTFSGLRRLCDTSSGNAIWVTEGSAKKIELENDSSTTETDEVKRLKADNEELAKSSAEELKQVKFDSERRETELAKSTAEEVKQLKADNERLETELAKSKCGCCVLM